MSHIDPKNIRCDGVEIPEADVPPLHRAIDCSLLVVAESVDMANQHGLHMSERLALTGLAVDAAVGFYAAQFQAAALREGLQAIAEAVLTVAPEIAGATAEAGTDIASALLDGLTARRNRRCRRSNT